MPPHPATGLPEPSPEQQQRSRELVDRIRIEIKTAGDSISFARYMELALYAPVLGYYASGAQKFGAGGDFVTAPELGSIFARCLARQCAPVLALTNGDVLEAGAGSGALAAELLLEMERVGQLPAHYFILELSTALRALQADTLRARAPHLLAHVAWLDTLPAGGFRGLILGNELLDALPVERFRLRAGHAVQIGVGLEHDRLAWKETAPDAKMQERLAPLALPEGYESEIGLAAEGWVRSAADALEHGVLLLIDYGFPRAEFYHPQRDRGTLMCHYRHRTHADPLILTGLQDITAHIDFTAIAAAGTAAGLELLGYTSQAMFLLGCGLDEVVAPLSGDDPRAHLTVTNEIKKLTLPQEMGELFKVIALGRGFHAPLRGFSIQDRRNRL